MEYLSIEDILNIHSVVIDETGGAHGVRERNALHTLEELPKQNAFGKEFYPGIHAKAALSIRNIIFSHPFVDGNKRTAMTCADVFLQLNGTRITAAKGEVESFALSVIAEHLELSDIAEWLEKHSSETA